MTTENVSASSQMPLLTFNSLYGILREEKKSRTLQSLPEKFYEGVKDFFDKKKEEIKKLKTENDSEKLSKEMRVYKNSKKIVEELVTVRLIKISAIGVRGSFYGDENEISKNILKKEGVFLADIEKSSKTIKEAIA